MSALRFSPFAIVVSVLAGACKDGGTAPVTPSVLVVSGGDNQTGPAGLPLLGALQVTLMGTDGRPFPGATVIWQVMAGGGSVSAGSVTTNANGVATTGLTLGRATGLNLVVASVTGVAPVAFNANSVSGPPTQITIAGDGQAALRGTPLPQPIVVDLADQFGNAVANTGVTFTASEGSFDPVSASTDVQGRAQAVWTLGPAIGNQLATVTVDTVATV